MKKYLKHIGLATLATAFLASCDGTIGGDEPLDFNTGINVIQFENAEVNAPAVADGEVKSFEAKIRAIGPALANLPAEVTVSFSVDVANSTAIEGTHFILESNKLTLAKADNYLGTIPIKIITQGITPPINYTLVLRIDNITPSNSELVISGNQSKVEITIAYSCFADLTGTYSVTNSDCNPTGLTAEITRNPDGSWHLTSADGRWLDQCTGNAGLFNPGNIFVVCGQVLPTGDLAFGSAGGSYSIGDILGGTWDPATGTLILQSSEGVAIPFFDGGPYFWTSTYVRQ